MLQVEAENRCASLLVLRDENLERDEPMLVNRRGQQLFDVRQRQVDVAVRNLPHRRDCDADEAVAMSVLAFGGLEEPRGVAGTFRIGRSSEFFLKIGKSHNEKNSMEPPDRDDATTSVYRPGLILPLTIVSAIVGIVYIVTGSHQPGDAWFFLLFWAGLNLPMMIRRRRAVILTSTKLCYRPAWGKTLEVLLNGIKRVTLIQPESGQEGAVLTLQIELLVSGQLYVPLDVRKSEELAERVIAAVKVMQS